MIKADLHSILLAFIPIIVYLFIRGWQALPVKLIVRSVYSGIILLFVAAPFLAFFFHGSISPEVANILRIIEAYWLIFMLFLFCAALLADFLRVLNFYFKIFPAWIKSNYSKIKFYYSSFFLVLMLALAFAGYIKFANPQIVRLNPGIDKKNRGFENMTFIAASDIHLGNVVSTKRLLKWIGWINNQKPDAIFLVGDIFDQNFDPHESQNAIKALRQLKARLGVFAVLGNHEYRPNLMDLNMAINYIENSGIKLLRDETFTLDNRINIIGRDDYTDKKRKSLDSLTAGLDTSLPSILLDHQPNHLDESVRNNIDLQISGHLHNGQMFPYNRIQSMIYELSYGCRKTGETLFYVTSGLGLSYLPLRLGTQSEIVLIHLKSNITE